MQFKSLGRWLRNTFGSNANFVFKIHDLSFWDVQNRTHAFPLKLRFDSLWSIIFDVDERVIKQKNHYMNLAALTSMTIASIIKKFGKIIQISINRRLHP